MVIVWYGFTHPDTLKSSHLNAAVTGPGVVVDEAEEKKKKYSCLSATYYSVPIAVETLGTLGVEASNLSNQLGRHTAIVTKDRRATEFLFQRLCVAIQRGNTSNVLGTVGFASDINSDDIFYL